MWCRVLSFYPCMLLMLYRNHRGHRTPPGPTFKGRFLPNKNRASAEKGGPKLSRIVSFGVNSLFVTGVIGL